MVASSDQVSKLVNVKTNLGGECDVHVFGMVKHNEGF
jgi:hypothetical protein